MASVYSLRASKRRLNEHGDRMCFERQTQTNQTANLPGNLVAQGLGRDDGHLLADALVGVEVHGQSSVVLLDDDLGGLLDSLRTNATLHTASRHTNRSPGAQETISQQDQHCQIFTEPTITTLECTERA